MTRVGMSAHVSVKVRGDIRSEWADSAPNQPSVALSLRDGNGFIRVRICVVLSGSGLFPTLGSATIVDRPLALNIRDQAGIIE